MLIKGNLGTPPNCENPWWLVGRLADANRLVGVGDDSMEEVGGDWTEGDVVATEAAAAAAALAAFMAAMAAMLARMGLA